MNCEVVLIESWIDREALIDLVDRYRYALNQYQIIVSVMPPAGIYPSMNYALSIFNGRTVTFLNFETIIISFSIYIRIGIVVFVAPIN